MFCQLGGAEAIQWISAPTIVTICQTQSTGTYS